MQLLSITPLQFLIKRGLPQTCIGLARTYLALGKRLKFSEQKLNFLHRCKSLRILPMFIINNVYVNGDILFNSQRSHFIDQMTNQLQLACLNHHIRLLYDNIRSIKFYLCQCKQDLYGAISDQFLFHDIIFTAEKYNCEVKDYHKQRLKDKLQWIILKYYPSDCNVRRNRVTQPVKDRVTVLDLDPDNPLSITDDERQLLSLGPNFAVSPVVDDKLLHDINVNMAHCAYKLRLEITSRVMRIMWDSQIQIVLQVHLFLISHLNHYMYRHRQTKI